MRRKFYRSGAGLSVQGQGQEEGQQHIATLRRQGIRRCFKDGCERYEKGYDIVLDLADPADANVARYIREGKAGRYEERLLVKGATAFHFLPGECPGHRLDWQDDPVYFVGQRKTVHDEFQERYQTGAEALVAATMRLQEMED